MCPEYKVNVYVDSKQDILNPENKAITQAVSRNPDWAAVKEVRKGKRFEVLVTADNRKTARKEVNKVVSQFLANPVIEVYKIASIKEIENSSNK